MTAYDRTQRFRSRRALALAIMAMLAVAAMLSSAKCYPAGTRVVVFIQGIYTTYDASGTQGSLVEPHRFDTLKAAFLAQGYQESQLLDFSYAGGTVALDGSWGPKPYSCDLTDRRTDDNLAPLEKMLADYRARHPDAHFTLVGHSLGGYLAFVEGAREAARPAAQKLAIDVVVTLDAPLSGVSPDKKIILDIIPCAKTYLAGGEIVAQKLDPTTPATRRAQTAAMAEQGVRLATMGNPWDCFWNPGHCLGGGWVDDSGTQFLDGQASISNSYAIQTAPLASHDAIVADANAVRDTVAFVGPP
jgi:pimeloyl-ACP methyl ester carboxylesterase